METDRCNRKTDNSHTLTTVNCLHESPIASPTIDVSVCLCVDGWSDGRYFNYKKKFLSFRFIRFVFFFGVDGNANGNYILLLMKIPMLLLI